MQTPEKRGKATELIDLPDHFEVEHLDKELEGLRFYGQLLSRYKPKDQARILMFALIHEREGHLTYKKDMEFLESIRRRLTMIDKTTTYRSNDQS